ncbi:MAG: YtxH protein [Candidatus Saccharibacteria bacterium]|nr:YtxH protein [Candidatus Saccharibacteria bacterium]
MADKHNSSNASKFAIGAAIAAGVGYLAGILTAPKSGKETREDLKHTANQAMTEADKQLKKLHTEIAELADNAKEASAKLSGKAKAELDAVIATANESRQRIREMLSSVHDGDADDKDLQKAIKDAKKAVDHLKKYLDK